MRAWNRSTRACSTTLRRAATLVAMVLSPCACLPAFAQDGPRPVLAGHTFLSTELVPDAFVRTYVRSSLGYAQAASLNYPVLEIRGDTIPALEGTLAYALLGFEYQYAVRNWIAVRVGLGMRTRLGTEVSSLVTEGVTVNSSFEFGWLARVHETPRTMLCGSLAVMKQTLTIIDMKQFVEDVIDDVPEPKLMDDVPTVRTAGALRFAWAASRPLGVTLLAETSYGESPVRDEGDSWEYGLGASVDFDAGAAFGVPVGVALASRLTSLPVITTSDNGTGSDTTLRIAYNGKRDFIIALDIMGVLNRENAAATPVWASGAAVSMRYYF
jgi:hypothetical protein